MSFNRSSGDPQRQPLLSHQSHQSQQSQYDDWDVHTPAKSAADQGHGPPPPRVGTSPLLAKAFYGSTMAGSVFLFPYLNLFLKDLGATDSQIGLLCAFRPWLGMASTCAGPILADAFKCHRQLLVSAFFLSAAFRASMWLFRHSLVEAALLLLLADLLGGPVGPMADSMVLAGCKTEADYGRQRLWGSVGWGLCAPLAGTVVQYAGIGGGFLAYACLCVPALIITTQLRFPPSEDDLTLHAPTPSNSEPGTPTLQSPRTPRTSAGNDGSHVVHMAQSGLQRSTSGRLMSAVFGLMPAALRQRRATGQTEESREGSMSSRSSAGQETWLMATFSDPPDSRTDTATQLPFSESLASPGTVTPADPGTANISRAVTSPASAVDAIVAANGEAQGNQMPDRLGTQSSERMTGLPEGTSSEFLGLRPINVPPPAKKRTGARTAPASGRQTPSRRTWDGQPNTSAQPREHSGDAGTSPRPTRVELGTSHGHMPKMVESPFKTNSLPQGELRSPARPNRGKARRPSEPGQRYPFGASPRLTGYDSGRRHTHHHYPLGVGGTSPRLTPYDSGHHHWTHGGGSPRHPGFEPGYHHPHGLSPRPTFYETALEALCALVPGHDLLGGMVSCPVDTTAHTAVNTGGTSTPTGHAFDRRRTGTGDVETLINTYSGPQESEQFDDDPSTPRITQRRTTGTGYDTPFSQALTQRTSVKPIVRCANDNEFFEQLKQLLDQPAVWKLLLQVLASGFGAGLVGAYQMLYARDIGAGSTLMGLMLTADCLAETPVFYFQGTLMEWMSPTALLNLSLGAMVLRLLLYAAIPVIPGCPPAAILPVELLQGLTLAGGWAAMCVMCKRLAPPGLQATLQGAATAVFAGLGGGLGGLVGGLLRGQGGLEWSTTWVVAACMVAALWGVSMVLVPRRSGSPPTKRAA